MSASRRLGPIGYGRQIDRFFHVQMTQSRHRFFQQSFNTLGDFREPLAGANLQLNRDGAITKDFGRNNAEQPRLAVLRGNQGRGCTILRRDKLQRPAANFRTGYILIVTVWLGRNERGAMAERFGKIILYCKNQIAAGETGGEPLRKIVQFADLFFATAYNERFFLQAGGQVASDQRYDEEENKIDDILRSRIQNCRGAE